MHDERKPASEPAEDQLPGAGGAKRRIGSRPEDQDDDDRRAPIGNGGTNEPAAFPPHHV